ncbi:MAG: type I-F CRISPR-associated protein Csy2 [Burkholderiaceae bacterium]
MLTSDTTHATTDPTAPTHQALLELPRLRVQNANAISSPLTWGFPAITAFTGFMTALARRLGPEAGIALQGVGVICHGFEAQVTQGGYTRSFALTRNPVLADGSTAAIVEEGRVHLDITLVLQAELAHRYLDDSARAELAAHIGTLVAGMRLAGGSVMPPLPAQFQRPPRPRLSLLAGQADDRASQFKRMRRRWLPGFALVLRDDLLQAHWAELQTRQPQATLLDAWLDLSRINHRATRREGSGPEQANQAEWATDSRPGWLVPMPVGFAALSGLHAPGSVAGVRDPAVPFRFVESVYAIGQWISPHRLQDTHDLLWHTRHDAASGLYRCINHFKSVAPATAETQDDPNLADFNADDYID